VRLSVGGVSACYQSRILWGIAWVRTRSILIIKILYNRNGLKNDRKPIQWLGDSRDRLRKFPHAARRDIGYQLSLIQVGRPATDWKPIPLVGPGVVEIRVHAENEYRVFYLAKFEEAIYVLHVFAKKTRKHSPLDVELGKKRYRELLERQR
jgi:phage-related protein